MSEPKCKVTMIIMISMDKGISNQWSPPCGVNTKADNKNPVVEATWAAEEGEGVAHLDQIFIKILSIYAFNYTYICFLIDNDISIF